MLRSIKFLGGIWVGASLLATVIAHALLYLFTGQVPVPSASGLRFMELDEAVEHVRDAATQLMEGYRG